MALIGLGYRHLSMSAASIGPVKAMVLTLEADRLAAFLDRELASSGNAESLRPALTCARVSTQPVSARRTGSVITVSARLACLAASW